LFDQKSTVSADGTCEQAIASEVAQTEVGSMYKGRTTLRVVSFIAKLLSPFSHG